MPAKKKVLPDDCKPMCKSCRFAEFDVKDDVGFCHRLPPQMVEVQDEIEYTFAVVNLDDWCGEYVGQVS